MGDPSGSNDQMGDSPALAVTGKIMVVAIMILFFVVVFVCFLHLYSRWFWWRLEGSTTPQLHSRRRRRRRFVFAPGQDPASNGAQRSGLDPAVLRSLPVLVYQPENFKDDLECAVCLSELVQGEKARILPKCNHGFHVDCIDMWFQSHSTCPLCRNPVASESSNSSCSSGAAENASENSQSSEAENSDATSGLDLESPNFPTNVLVWGNQTQVSSVGTSLDEGPSQPPCSSSSSSAGGICSSTNNRRQGMLVIDIPSERNLSSLSPSASRFAEDDLKSPMTSRLKSFKRLLSKRLNPCSPSSVDVEQAGRGQG